MGHGFKHEKFHVVKYYAHGGLGDGSGKSPDNAAAIVDGDVMAIEAESLIEKVYLRITAAITGTTALVVGDDDSANGFILDQAGNFATPGLYSWDAKGAGAYLRIQTAGVTDAADIYVVPNAKYYAAAGKEVKLDVTTASTAGAFEIHVEGRKFV